ncbi:MAG: FAD-dependent oxidoreductase, partial [Promethearchaeia archaeon]
MEPYSMSDYEVIIAGAGTAGCTTAYTLAKEGHSVLLLDRKEKDLIGKK